MIVPMLQIVPLTEAEIDRQKILNIDQYDLLIVVSPNAARQLLHWLDVYWPQLPEHPRWIAVGAATAQVLSRENVSAAIPRDVASSEGVLALPMLQDVADQKILLVKGEGGRTLLFDELSRRGARVAQLSLYRREPVRMNRDELMNRMGKVLPDVLIATSVELLENLDASLSKLEERHRSIPLIVASERIQSAAQALGYERIILATSAADDGILAALNVIG